ncbi:endonuclease/exonuclease/phosphatase family protein [Shewanella waksmanii]|uniref:endonuclease/exonuclease/phosphatase family protein n=1 Tax=Shewanella waksmanii TaxID=213783 RepID=UPI0004AC6327|nr:endonuclease/exonuclease/phosphatase family protein [Shewanella waksmanii]
MSTQNEHTQFNIATLNLFNFVEPPNAYYDFENIYTAEQWQKKLTWISRYIDLQQPDVIGFQEVFSIEALKTLMQQSGYQYFAVVDEPSISDDFIYSCPVVALASKFPIVEINAVAVEHQLLQLLSLPSDFAFSRIPLRVTVATPLLGSVDFFVVHFKSQRGIFDVDEQVQTDMGNPERFALEAVAKWGAAQQRGAEAVLLRYSIASRREQTQNPCVLLGDFNESLQTGVLKGLVSQDSRLKNQLSEHEFTLYSLSDAYELCQANQYAPSAVARAPTHYHLNHGNVLDYILLSAEFNSQNPQSLAEVTRYHTFDQHLTNPQYATDSHSSDHAAVCVTCRIRN